jgi:hypothetical protein
MKTQKVVKRKQSCESQPKAKNFLHNSSSLQDCQVQKLKKAIFGHKQFQKGQVIKSKNSTNKG